MTITKKATIVITLLTLFVAFSFYGNDASAKGRGRKPKGPPPEAYTACEEKSAGDAAEFQSPRGDTVTGTCEQEGERLVLRPDNPPSDSGRSDNTND